ncbi:hypothetical protein [Nocardia puris]|uniref:hypothetical protein n=1 Tax=Nocardia puris TaxID=208602 RepID=UPI001E3DF33B|nr:hypothetical protein [Nocardia puris]
MTAMWFGLAAIALVGAIVLLYFDRVQRQRTGHARQVWAKAQGYTYVSVEPALPSTWRRGALAKLGYLSAVDVVSGIRKGEKFVLFDLEDAATLVAVRRQIGSDIDVDMRLKTASPPKDADLELLGAIGDRVVFATNPEIARHAVDQRMVAFIESLPETVQMLWSEGNWTLGMLNVGTVAKDWESAIDAVLRLSGLLHVLPPVADPRGFEDRARGRAPEREAESPRGAARVAPPEGDERDSDLPASRGVGPRGYELDGDDDFDPDGPRAYADRAENRAYDDEPDYDDDFDPDGPRAYADRAENRAYDDEPDYDDEALFEDEGYDEPAEPAPLRKEPAAEPARRPSLAVVPDAKSRDEQRREDEDPLPRGEWDLDEDPARAPESTPDRPGGPFHPGFRPYQGPVPK